MNTDITLGSLNLQWTFFSLTSLYIIFKLSTSFAKWNSHTYNCGSKREWNLILVTSVHPYQCQREHLSTPFCDQGNVFAVISWVTCGIISQSDTEMSEAIFQPSKKSCQYPVVSASFLWSIIASDCTYIYLIFGGRSYLQRTQSHQTHPHPSFSLIWATSISNTLCLPLLSLFQAWKMMTNKSCWTLDPAHYASEWCFGFSPPLLSVNNDVMCFSSFKTSPKNGPYVFFLCYMYSWVSVRRRGPHNHPPHIRQDQLQSASGSTWLCLSLIFLGTSCGLSVASVKPSDAAAINMRQRVWVSDSCTVDQGHTVLALSGWATPKKAKPVWEQ